MMRFIFGLASIVLALSSARADLIEFTITNKAPTGGVFLTPTFFGVHNGGFTLFTPGQSSSAGLERIAEDGGPATLLLQSLRAVGGSGLVTTTGVIAPGQSASVRLEVNPAVDRFFSFATMVIPSNDAFIGNPVLIPLFDASGNLIGRSGSSALRISGAQVWDSGTEVNDELSNTTAFLDQSVPDTGTAENGVVRLHAGFLGSQRLGGPLGGILSTPNFVGADFTTADYQVAEISVAPVPAPPAVILLGIAALGIGLRRFAARRSTVIAAA